MTYLLDTNALSETRLRVRAHPEFRAWFDAVPADICYVSVVSILEIELGVLKVERKDKVQGAALRNWLERRLLTQFKDRVLAVDTAVARRCAQLHVPDRRPERDALIAATALVHGLTIVTRNVRDFESTGATLLNPWN